jgi:hypothetical protein
MADDFIPGGLAPFPYVEAPEPTEFDRLRARVRDLESELADCKRIALEQANKLQKIDRDMFGMWMPKRLREIEAALREMAKR